MVENREGNEIIGILFLCRFSRKGFDMWILFFVVKIMIWLLCCKKYYYVIDGVYNWIIIGLLYYIF